MQLRAGGLAFFAPVCSSFVFINRGTARRSICTPLGDCSLDHVVTGNLLAARTALLVMVATWKMCCWIVEQPASSLLIDHPRFQELVSLQTVYRHRVCMGWYGASSLKPTLLCSNARWVSELDRKTTDVPKNPGVVRTVSGRQAHV